MKKNNSILLKEISEKNIQNCFSIGIFIFFLVGFIYRFIYFKQISVMPDFNFMTPGLDMYRYDELAKSILSGNLKGAFYQAPLYPFFLSLIYLIMDYSYFAVRVVQAFIDSINIYLIYYIGRKTINPLTGFIAGFAYSIYSIAIFYTSILQRTTVFTFMLLLFVSSFIFAEERKKVFYFIIPGFILGITALCRESVIFILPFISLGVLTSKNISKKISKRLASILIIIFTAAILILPAIIHNYKAAGKICISTAGPVNLYIGNAHDSSGTYHIPPSLTEKSKNQNEINWVVETLKEIKQYPRITLRNFFNKILLFWGGYEIPNNVDFYLHTEYSSILRSGILSFRIIVALSFVGFIVTIKNLRKTWIVYSALLATFLPCIIFFVLGRLRFPALPFLMILASAGTVWCFMRLFQKNPFPLIIVFIYLICLKNFIWFPGEYTASSNSINNLGVAERSKKEYHKAGLLFIRAILADPYKIKPHINLALTYIAQGIYNEALKECFFVLSLNPEHKNANSLAGEILFHKRDFSESLAYFSKVAKLYPDDWAALYFCGLCNYNIGKEKAALEYLEKAFEQATGNSKKITQDAIKLIKKTNEK